MIKLPRKAISKVALPLAVIAGIVCFSAFNARKVCDELIQAQILYPPRYSTRFVLNPNHYMDGADQIGFNPGWVVTYAPQTREYGTAFYVTFFGKVRARGTPDIVTAKHKLDDVEEKKFIRYFADADAAVKVGSKFPNVVSVLGHQYMADTNADGSFDVLYIFMPRAKSPNTLLTNGFHLKVSNGVVVWKGYSELH